MAFDSISQAFDCISDGQSWRLDARVTSSKQLGGQRNPLRYDVDRHRLGAEKCMQGEGMELFEALGFQWDRAAIPTDVPTYSAERVCFRFHKMLPEFVWDASVLEGNPFTFPEVKTLLDGITVGGRRISDQEQILNLVESSKLLLKLVRSGRFCLDKATFVHLHRLVARNEALEWGHFRGEGDEWNYTPDVGLGEHGRYTPLPTVKGGANLDEAFRRGVDALNREVPNAFEKGAAFFLFGALQQFFFDGNKRTSRFMMNGVLMSNGIDAISIPAAKAQVFNEKMIRFYLNRDATEMLHFLVDCHPEGAQGDERTQQVGPPASSAHSQGGAA